MDAEVRKVIDTLASHAAASSTGAESFIAFVQQNQAGNPAYAFLTPGHEHHAYWLDTLEQAQRTLIDEKKEHATEPAIEDHPDEQPLATNIPVRLIPAVVEANLRWSDPYTPADAKSIEIAAKSTRAFQMDEYLTLRLQCFEDDLEEYERRPGVSYSEARAGVGVPTGRQERNDDDTSLYMTRNASSGGFHGGDSGKGLGYHRSRAGQSEAALDAYRSMKKRGQGYGTRIK